jgi:hypothetical protein
MRWFYAAWFVLAATWGGTFSTSPLFESPNVLLSIAALPAAFIGTVCLIRYTLRVSPLGKRAPQLALAAPWSWPNGTILFFALTLIFGGCWGLFYVVFLGHPAIGTTVLALALGSGLYLGHRYVCRDDDLRFGA